MSSMSSADLMAKESLRNIQNRNIHSLKLKAYFWDFFIATCNTWFWFLAVTWPPKSGRGQPRDRRFWTAYIRWPGSILGLLRPTSLEMVSRLLREASARSFSKWAFEAESVAATAGSATRLGVDDLTLRLRCRVLRLRIRCGCALFSSTISFGVMACHCDKDFACVTSIVYTLFLSFSLSPALVSLRLHTFHTISYVLVVI